MQKLSFSGHESFTCRQLWLKKIFDFVLANKQFTSEDAVVDLGVGKNMVNAMRYWGRAFGLLDEQDNLTQIAKVVFERDPYLEDIGSLWLLHYQLIKTNRASIFNLVFNNFRKERIEFTQEHLTQFVLRTILENDLNAVSVNTIAKDVGVFLRTYVKPERVANTDVEESFSALLIDLELVKKTEQTIDNKARETYSIPSDSRVELPLDIFLYSILESFPERDAITFHELLTGLNSPGSVFALHSEGLFNKIEQLQKQHKNIVYSETAGNQVLQLKGSFKPLNILDGYYRN